VLNNTGDERDAREGKIGIVIIHKPDREAWRAVTVKQMKKARYQLAVNLPYGWMQSTSQDVNRCRENTSEISRNADSTVRNTKVACASD